jgi:hypothetical protein
MKIASLFLALAVAAVAADSPPALYRLTVVDVPAASSAEFYDVQRDTAEVYKANKAPVPRLAWTSITGVPRFVTFASLAGLDTLNEPTWLSQQGEERSRQARQTRLRNATGHTTSKILSAPPDVAWDPAPDAAPAAYIAVAIYEVKPGKSSDFLALIKQSIEAAKKVGKAKNVFVYRTSYGASWYEYHVVTSYASLADIPTSGTATRAAMGDAAYTAFVEKMSATINSVARDLYRYRPEYSYLPAK